MAGILSKVFDPNKREIKRLTRMAEEIDTLGSAMAKLSDDELRNKTEEFKIRYQSGESLDDLLNEAFAVVREGAKRVLGLYPYHVQLMGGISLHEGNISEMKTGEGKTLTSTMPVYLNALSGKGVHVVTVNEYLASRDAAEMGQLYNFLGLTVGLNTEWFVEGRETGSLCMLILRTEQIMNLVLIICVIIWCCIKNKWFSARFIMPLLMKLTRF